MKNNNLENLFRSKFKDSSLDDMDWLDPSDAIFDKAFASFEEEDGNKKPFIWRFAASGVFLALIAAGALFFWNSSKQKLDVNQIASESISIENGSQIASVESVRSDAQTNVNNDATQTQTVDAESVNTIPRGIRENSSSNTGYLQSANTVVADPLLSFGRNSSIGQNIDSRQSRLDANSSIVSNKVISSGSNGVASANNIGNSDFVNSGDNADLESKGLSTLASRDLDVDESFESGISVLPQLNIDQLVGSNGQLPILTQNVILDVDNKKNFAKSRSISLSGGRNYSSISHNAEAISHLLELGGNQELQGGWSVGIDFRTDLNPKWTLIGGVSLNRINMQSWTRSNSIFDSSLASINAGQRVFNTDVGFVSPTTGFRDNAEFVIENVAIEDGDLFDHNMEVNQDISIVSANVGIGRRLIQSNKFTLTADFSVGLDYISRIQENLNLEVKFEENIVYQKQSDWVNHNGINRIGVNAGLNIRAEWSLTNRFGLFFSPSYRRSLTSIKNNEIIQTRSFYNLYNLSAGISFRF